MFRRWSSVAFAAGLVFSSTLPLSSQQGPSFHDLLIGLRDTVTRVEAAAGEFNRDLKSAGRETVLARASQLRTQCQLANAALSDAAPRLRPPANAARTRRRTATALVNAIGRLQRVLRAECERGFRSDGPGSWTDSVRAWGPYRGSEITKAIRAYEAAAAEFAAAEGFKMEPRLPAG